MGKLNLHCLLANMILLLLMTGCADTQMPTSTLPLAQAPIKILSTPVATLTPTAVPYDVRIADYLDHSNPLLDEVMPLGMKLYHCDGQSGTGDTIDEVFLNDDIGWKRIGLDYSMFHHGEVVWFQTTDGGQVWNEISDSATGNSNMSGYEESKIFFINENTGWEIGTASPMMGWFSFKRTDDGGATWTDVDIDFPEKYADDRLITSELLFFSERDGFLR